MTLNIQKRKTKQPRLFGECGFRFWCFCLFALSRRLATIYYLLIGSLVLFAYLNSIVIKRRRLKEIQTNNYYQKKQQKLTPNFLTNLCFLALVILFTWLFVKMTKNMMFLACLNIYMSFKALENSNSLARTLLNSNDFRLHSLWFQLISS